MASSDHTAADDVIEEQATDGISWSMLVTAGIFGLLIGGIAAWATANLEIAAYAFVVMALGSGYWLYQKPIPSAAISVGLYVLALELVLTPVLFYVPEILGSSEGESAEAAGAFIGSIMGLFIWGFAFFVIALVIAAIGWFTGRRAKKKLAA